VVTLDAPAIIDRVTRGEYDAAYFGWSRATAIPA
jgi:hypothetical protein